MLTGSSQMPLTTSHVHGDSAALVFVSQATLGQLGPLGARLCLDCEGGEICSYFT